MRALCFVLFVIGLFVISGCSKDPDYTMVLLDEPIKEVNISESAGIGQMNLDIAFSFEDKNEIKAFERAIKTAVIEHSNTVETKPDYDIMVEYEEGFPTHAIHLWLGEERERSSFMYMVGEGETYTTTVKVTKQLRELLHPEP